MQLWSYSSFVKFYKVLTTDIMSPRQLKYFLEVYNQRNIRKVAKGLVVSPQAISKTIKEIEEELNVTLFLRGKNTLEPTSEADYLKNHAIKILDEFEKINNINSFFNRPNKGLKIYCVNGFLQYMTIDFIKDFQKAYPLILLDIIETSENYILEKLNKREIDLAIITKNLSNDMFSYSYLYSNRNCLVINKNNPLANKKDISVDDLNLQLIVGKGSEDSYYRSNISNLFQKNINIEVKLETTNDSLIIKMAEDNMAIGITLDFIAFANKNENIVIRPFKEFNDLRNVFLVESSYSALTNEEKIFRDFLIKWIKEHKPQLFNWEIN